MRPSEPVKDWIVNKVMRAFHIKKKNKTKTKTIARCYWLYCFVCVFFFKTITRKKKKKRAGESCTHCFTWNLLIWMFMKTDDYIETIEYIVIKIATFTLPCMPGFDAFAAMEAKDLEDHVQTCVFVEIVILLSVSVKIVKRIA